MLGFAVAVVCGIAVFAAAVAAYISISNSKRRK